MTPTKRYVPDWAETRRIWVLPIAILLGTTAAVVLLTFLLDWRFHRPPHLEHLGPLELLVHYDIETLQNALGSLAQTVVAVLGIVTTVVAIVVQLAATRYTPRVTELFFRERTNLLVMGFFVVSSIGSVWVSLSVGNGFVPVTSVVLSVASVTASLLLLVPYFAYVFNFLDPERVIRKIQEEALSSARAPEPQVERSQDVVLSGIEQLADIAQAAVSQKDKLISARAVDALRILAVSYSEVKAALPRAWFEPSRRVRANPDFVAMNADALDDLVREQLWVEWKVLRQYQAIYNEAIDGNPDMNYLIAINTRYLGEAALSASSRPAIGLVVKFFNTYMRATLNKRQVRVAYNVMNQYRQLAERTLHAGQAPLAREIAGYFKYYGQIANGMGLGFVTETIAYDVATLCELAHRLESPAHDVLLAALLELDKEAETEAQESTLRGVRKAQARLATFYLQRGDAAAARRIHDDMKGERLERLTSIRDELLKVASKDFWEVIDRGANFDYLEDDRKQLLREFFAWFEVAGAGAGGAGAGGARPGAPPPAKAEAAAAAADASAPAPAGGRS